MDERVLQDASAAVAFGARHVPSPAEQEESTTVPEQRERERNELPGDDDSAPECTETDA